MIRQRYGADADELLQLCPAASDEEPAQLRRELSRSRHGLADADVGPREGEESGVSLLLRASASRNAEIRGFHAAEIQYAFGNLNPARTWEGKDHTLSAAMHDYWVNFATNGEPNKKAYPYGRSTMPIALK